MDNTEDIINDPIVAEVRKAREAHARKFNYDLRAIVQDLKKYERQGEREVVSFSPKPVEREKGAA